MTHNSFRSVKTHLRFSGWLEGVSFLVLLGIAMPLKYMADLPQMVRYVGMAHGVLFIWYVLSVLVAREAYNLNLRQTAIALAGSFLPFGTFYADKKVFQQL